MTPSEAASILKVSEEDVIAAINDGTLKAKKLGSAYRISKESLEGAFEQTQKYVGQAAKRAGVKL